MYPRTLSARTLRRLDVFLVIWAVVWIAVAVYTSHEVRALNDLSGTIVKTGAAVSTTGKALQDIAAIPLVGATVRTLADQVAAAGQSAVASGRSTHTSVHNLSVLLGIAIGLIPIAPVLALYVPLRVGWRRERQAVVEALARFGGEVSLELYLARRALANLPYHELHELGGDPWSQLDAERRRRLAEAELRRLGIETQLPDVPGSGGFNVAGAG